MADLSDNLRALHACLQSDDPPSNAIKAHNIVGDIGHTCLQDVTGKDIDYSCSLLFAKDTGVVSFLRGVVRYEEYQRAKVELLDTLKTFTTKWPHKVLPYAVDIKDTCMGLFVRDKYAKVKCAALNLLVEVLTHATVSKVAGELDVTKLIEKLFLELTVATKHPSTVKQLVYHLLGLLTEIYPEDSVNYSERLADTYVRTMKKEMTSKTRKPEMPIIVGCLLGLSHFLVNFTQSAEEEAKYSFEIYKATKMAIAKDIQHSKYDMPRAGLLLFKRHGPQFNLYIIDDYEILYETLIFWCNHHNKEMLHAGMSAMDTFLKQVSEMLVARAKQGRKDGAIFKFFIQRFRGIMDNPDSSSKEVSLAIKGYGLFAAPCKLFLSTSDVQFMFNEMMQRSDQIFFNEAGIIDERVISLPSFLDALASIISQLDDVSDTFSSSLERLVVVLMENVPKINSKMHSACFIAIMRIFHALMPKGATFKTFMSRVVYQSLIRTCSHPIVIVTEESGLDGAEAEITLDEKPKISYKDYLDMWHHLLDHTKFKILLLEGRSVEEQKLLTEVLYHELLSSTLRIIDRLDLGSQKEEDLLLEMSDESRSSSPQTVSADPSSGLQAAKPKDFIVFINLVDFCRDLLPHIRVDLFKNWIFKFGHELIIHSTRHPLVSGFYKLLSVCMTLCTKTSYFKEIQGPTDHAITDSIKMEDSMEVDIENEELADLHQREACFLLFSKFAREVLTRMKQYKDDLLASCLTFILSLPYEIVSAEISSVVPALQLAFRLGVSYLTLAIVGLDALEGWTRHLPPHVIRPHYKTVLPCLDPYLKTGREKESDQTVSLVSKHSNRKTGKRKLPVKLLAQTRKDAVKADETQLMKVQQRCVSLLGSLGGSANHYLVTSGTDDIWKEPVAWDKDVKHLKFDMPFMDIKPVILFDSFLPRIAELATTSSDRQTKVAACELLHSLVLYMVGRGAQKPTATDRRQPMESLYRKLLPVIITLACDVEQVAKQLFEPLLFQLIHWFTGNKKYESPETMAMLDTLIDGIVDPKDTARRDFSAKCVKEFLVWSIKQTSRKKMEHSPYNIKSLLKRLYSLSQHPSAFKRLGSALAFNNIYTVFREEDSLINVFIFEILVNYLESLALAHNDDKSLGTVEQCQQALNHIERIIKQRHEMLSEVNSDRVLPREWNEASLPVAVRWLIRQCGRPHTEARHAAMKLVCTFSPFVQNLKTPQAYFARMLKESGPQYFIMRFEYGKYKAQSRSGLFQCQTMAKLGDSFTLKTALNWYDILLATLDSYTWTFGQRLLTPSAIFIVSGNKGTAVFKVLNHFLSELAQEDIAAAARLFKEKQDLELFTPHENEQYDRMKCTAIVRFLNFFTTMLQIHKTDSLKVVPTSFWSDSLWELLVKCVIQPTSLGFNMADVEVMMNLPQQTNEVLNTVKLLPPNIAKGFTRKLQEELRPGGKYDLESELPTSLQNASDNQMDLLLLVKGFTQLQNSQLLIPALPHVADPKAFAVKLLQTVFKGMTTESKGELFATQLTPKDIDLSNALLDLSFALGLKPRDIMDVLLDKTKVRLVGSSTSDHGALLFAVFGSSLNKHLLSMTQTIIPVLVKHAKKEWSIVGGVLCGMLDALSRDRHLRKREGSKIVGLVMNEWPQLQTWWEGSAATQETKAQAVTVLTKAIVVDSKVVTDPNASHFTSVFEMYLNLLTDRDTPLAFKSRVLDLVAFFVGSTEGNVKKLKTRLDRLVADNFPMKSSEFVFGSPKYSDYITALNKILSGLHISGSLMMLELVISIMCREPKHSHEEEIQNTFMLFIKRLPMDKHKAALDVSYGIFRKEGSFPSEIRRAALERVCLTMLRIVHRGALIEFFSEHIKEIMATIENRLNKVSEDAFSCQLISKICSFELLEVMFSRLTKDDVCSKTSRINSVYKDYAVETGKELATAITKLSNQAKGEDCRGESLCVDLRRQYHCAAYNTLVAVISCTQTDIKFYNGFLFNENLTKGQFLLDNLVDPNRKYTFDIEMETPLARRKRFVAIRNEVRDGRGVGEDVPASTSVHYLASQYLADSSLGTDISQFDFGNSVASATLVSGSMGSMSRSASVKRTESDASQEASVTVEDDYVEMEMDEFNQHECMASMTALLQHMMRNNITPAVEKGVSPASMPPWMDHLHKKLKSHTTPSNTKLFIAKLIVNTEEVFRPYAKFWLSPLVQIIVNGETKDPGIHYFIVDIVVTLLSWHTVAIPEDSPVERRMASALLEFLLKNCHHSTKRILRNNLDVLKTLVEVWKERLAVPYEVIYKNFSKPDKGTSNMTGIQMLGVILTNKLPPYSQCREIAKDRFFQHLAMNMTNSHKPVYSAASEVVGMALKHLSEKEKNEESVSWRETYMNNISAMLSNIQQTKPDVFITCVYGMQRHYPQAVDNYVSKVLFLLPRLHGDFRTQCLEIILSRSDHVENIYVELKSKDLDGILMHRDEACQQVGLKLLYSIMSKLKGEELLTFIPAITSFSKHPSEQCRGKMYEIFMWIYDNYREEDNEVAHKIISAAKEGLLSGLSDEDLKNRLTVQNFWSHETRLPVATIDRMVAMLEAMYSPSTEDQYLAYATNLLLEMTSKSPDYNRPIYEHPLSECRFEDVQVMSSWRQRHAAMTPLFVATQLSQGQSDSSSLDDSIGGQVRATQEGANFTPTQAAGASKGPYNWLTQSSMDTYSDHLLTLPTTQESQTSLLFTIGKPPPKPYRKKGPGPGFGKGKVGGDEVDGKQAEKSEGSEIMRLKKRFLKDQDSSLYFAKRNARMNKLREDLKKEQKSRRENTVTMYRRYRTGDFPDIQINFSYIIAPLQALAQRDKHVARMLFGSLFKSIFPEIEKMKTEREAREMITQITESLNNMLSNSTQYSPAFIACVLDIALEFPRRLKLEAGNVNTACVTSQQQPLGIILLEEMLLGGDEGLEERPAKRARHGTQSTAMNVSKDTTTWIELARLYKSLNSYDELRGIFSAKVGTQKVTMDALEAEMRTDYKKALQHYNEGLARTDWDDDPPNEAEQDLWDTSRLECCANLSDWSKLEQYTSEAIDERDPPNLNKLWDDTYHQEHFLPYLIRGRLKLMLEGERQQVLLDFVDEALQVPERKALLESSYPEELALMYMWQEDYDRARHYSNLALQAFLEEWSSLNILMENNRASSLRSLQKLTELKEFLAFMGRESNFGSQAPANNLIRIWMNRSPDSILDTTAIWDDIVTNRCVYLDHISGRLEVAEVKDEPGTSGCDPWNKHKVSLWLSQADSACRQDNFQVALKQIRKAHKVVKSLKDDELQIQWTHTYSYIHVRRAEMAALDAVEKVQAITTAVDQLNKYSENKLLASTFRLGREHNMLKGAGVLQLTTILQEDVSLTDLDPNLQTKIRTIAVNKEKIIEGLVEQGYQHLKLAVGISHDEELGSGRATDMEGINQAHMAFVRYCDKYLHQMEDDEDAAVKCSSIDSFHIALVTSLLAAMKNDSVEARQRFPRLLQVIEAKHDAIDIFIKKCGEIPCWMFLGWVSQLTAVLDKPEAPAVFRILLDIANTYPQALVYPFKMSDDGYDFAKTPVGKKGKDVRDKLFNILSKNKLINALIGALEQFGQPEALFKDWMADMMKLLAPKPGHRDVTAILKEFKQMQHEMMEATSSEEEELYDSQSSASSIPVKIAMGKYRRKVAKEVATKFEKMCGKDGRKIIDITQKAGHEGFAALGAEMTKAAGNPPGNIKEYSLWLSDFQAANYDVELELPGQYTGLTKPMPEYHVKINGFDEKVLVMSSLRKPKRVTIRGNDEKDYRFLVKCGEDLRQDQRIEQLFAIMNDVFMQDANCRQRKYQLRTYQVIPMTTRVGMIEWMKGTMPLKDFLTGAMTPNERALNEPRKGPWADHNRFIGGDCQVKEYLNSYKVHSRSDTVTAFKRREEMVPWDLSRRAYKMLSSSQEAYFSLRHRFAVSHGLLSACQYIVGIGDRHLSNFMIDLETGAMVGIDFGHAFGSATQFLPIPELMPLRLTRQIRNLLLPLREKGLIEGTMVHALRALRKNCDLLMATMDVFIKEPSIDWKQNAERQRKKQSSKEDSESDSNWYPKQKVEYARKKLQGHHPSYIMRDELALGFQRHPVFKHMEAVLLGDVKFDIRARLPKRNLSVEQQVACLLNQASDPNILGRMYHGWNSWM